VSAKAAPREAAKAAVKDGEPVRAARTAQRTGTAQLAKAFFAPRLITTLRKVPPGTEGAVSLPGTLAGIAAATVTAALGLALGLLGDPGTMLLVALAAFLGTVADSLIGARYPRIGNEATNLLCTLAATVLMLPLT
jgi:uncharacterized protein (TIGR00297 family)